MQQALEAVTRLRWGARSYADLLAQQEGRDVAFEQANPITSTAAQLGGGVAALGPVAGTELGATALGLKGTSLGSRALAGGLSGAGLSAADAATRGSDVGQAALYGGALGAAFPAVATGVGKGVQALRGALAPAATTPQNVARIGGMDLPLTTGEVSGNAAAQSLERNAARGTEGQLAQDVAQPFFENRQQGIDQATQNIQAGMHPAGQVLAEKPNEAGNIISGALANAQSTAKQGVDQLYDVVRANPNVIPADAFGYLSRRIKADLTVSTDPVTVSSKTTPAASKMLDQLDAFKGVPTNKADFLAPSKATGSTLADVDQLRQELLATKSAAANDADRRASGRIIGAFDKQINQIAPSPELAAARAAHSQYRQTFFQNGPRDTIGRNVERIIGGKGAQAATPSEVAGLLYDAPKGNSPRLVERLQTVFGQGSPEFAAVKQGYLSHIMESPAGVPWESQKLASRLTDALFGKGAELTNATFAPPERAELAKLAAYLKQITPKPGTVNVSGTAAPILKRLGGLLPRGMMGLAGLHIGGPIGGVVGMAAQPVQKNIGERLAARGVQRSLYGTTPTPPQSPISAALLRQLAGSAPPIFPQLNRQQP